MGKWRDPAQMEELVYSSRELARMASVLAYYAILPTPLGYLSEWFVSSSPAGSGARKKECN